MRGTDLVQRREVPGQVRPKVLGSFGQVRDVLETQQDVTEGQQTSDGSIKRMFHSPPTHPET